MDIPAISCPSCNANVESANHVFFECDIATDMWKLVFRWCDIPLFQASSWDSFNDWEQSLGMLLKERNTATCRWGTISPAKCPVEKFDGVKPMAKTFPQATILSEKWSHVFFGQGVGATVQYSSPTTTICLHQIQEEMGRLEVQCMS
ncbi:hypothetical protein Tco_0907103 [Tanacetum coccineum]|uniref:Reverse transcriptase zinc-binding domain-containing protein n=1 Tax=Tanacetum coccineum TaxID=301880 RepID=A0ABQ5CJ93_9ASTR